MAYPDWNEKIILIVEDEEKNYLLLEKILSHSNVKLLWAINGEAAIEVCEKYTESIDLILMDIRMPVMDGFEAVRIVKKKWSGIPVVAQTDIEMAEDKADIYSSGFDAYVTKPINDRRLYIIIENLLQNK